MGVDKYICNCCGDCHNIDYIFDCVNKRHMICMWCFKYKEIDPNTEELPKDCMYLNEIDNRVYNCTLCEQEETTKRHKEIRKEIIAHLRTLITTDEAHKILDNLSKL